MADVQRERREGEGAELRCELLSAEQLAALAAGPLSPALTAGPARRSFHRDVYFDTADETLRHRGVMCRIRSEATGKAILTLRITGATGDRGTRVDAPVSQADPAATLASNNVVARQLRGIVDPASLVPRLALEVERLTRDLAPDWLRRPRTTIHLDHVTVRGNGSSASFFQMCAHRLRGRGAELRLLERALAEGHGVRRSTLQTYERAELAIKWARLDDAPRRMEPSDRARHTPETASALPELINPNTSLLAFHQRVLALAEDPATPVGERLRFLAIVASNLDEFFMVRMGAMLAAAGEAIPPFDEASDGLTASGVLAAVADLVDDIAARHARCLGACFRDLAHNGIHVVPWRRLTAEQQAEMSQRFRDDIQPLLTPFAMTLSPGHPLPRLAHLSLGLALILRGRTGASPRFAELEIPPSVPRFLDVPGSRERTLVLVEEVIRAQLDTLYPGGGVEQAFLFRVTRSAELELDETRADDLIDEVARAAARRGQGTVVRVEVERSMPPVLRALLLEDARREQLAAGDGSAVVADVEETDGLLDARRLSELELPRELLLPRLEPRRPFAAARSVFGAIGAVERAGSGGVLVHHPFDSFADTVGRFVHDAATDPDVLAIKMTLYRVGDPSPVADALLDAARCGKSVTVFVELKARFDEALNVAWARALEAAGGHVVRGIIGIKNHAKVALVVRRDREGLRRYVHIGTGNYNAKSGEQYTDLSLFTTDDDVVNDVAELFNELTGMAEPPRHASRALLIAPHRLLTGLLEYIDREAAHARAGRPARITAKLNGLSDPDVIRALYRASSDGVPIDLVVRGICTARPALPGRSERLRVVSVVGRFLEHSRIYRFANGGAPRYFIGSADMRPRNLRRRVELLVPIRGARHQRLLDDLLALYVNDPTAWVLNADGTYVQRDWDGPGAQAVLAARCHPVERSDEGPAGVWSS
jgi:polyphosphate kinase